MKLKSITLSIIGLLTASALIAVANNKQDDDIALIWDKLPMVNDMGDTLIGYRAFYQYEDGPNNQVDLDDVRKFRIIDPPCGKVVQISIVGRYQDGNGSELHTESGDPNSYQTKPCNSKAL